MSARREEAEAPQMVARTPSSRTKTKIQGLSKTALAERHWRGGLHGPDQQDRNTTMAKMLVIYKTPADPEAFDRHYFEVHVPLAKKLPGLRRYDISRRPIIKRSAGEMPYLVGTLYFDSLADMQSAFATEIGIACAADRRILAPGDDDLTMLLFDVDEV